MHIRAAMVALAMLAGPALAGEPYTAPALQPARTLEPPADLRADATALLQAVQTENLDAIGRWIAPQVTIVSAGLDMGLPRHVETAGPWPNGRAALAALGQDTGGDWDLPPDADIGEFLSAMELDFIEGSLTDGQPWGTDPLLEGTICTYGFHDFSPAEVQKVADQLGIASSSFVMVDDGAAVRDKPGGKQIGTLSAGRLYAMDYDTDSPADWMALHLPQGGVGFIAVGEEGLSKPYASGLCFRKGKPGWQVVGQASTGL